MRTAMLLLGATAVLLGLLPRVLSIRDFPLAVDEYYSARSIDLVLEHGVPRFETGGYYTRGLPYQYLCAAARKLPGLQKVAYRLVSLCFGLLSIVLTYFYVGRFVPKKVAFAVALTLLFSSWHLEFSRFIRMYSALQCTTLAFLLTIDTKFLSERYGWRYLPHIILILSMLFHKLSVLLVPLLFVPLISSQARLFKTPMDRIMFTAVSTVAGFLCYLLTKFDFRNFNVTDRFPVGFTPPRSSLFRMPDFPFWSLGDNPLINILAPVLLSAAIVGLLYILSKCKVRVTANDYAASAILVFSVAHNFLVASAILFWLVMKPGGWRSWSRRTWVSVIIAVAIMVGWICVALSTEAPWVAGVSGQSGDGLRAWIGEWRRVFAGWPDLLPVVKPLVKDLPILSIFCFGSLLVMMFFDTAGRGPASGTRFFVSPSFIVIYVFVCQGILFTQYERTRYLYFIYPMMLSTIAIACFELTKLVRRKSLTNTASGGVLGLVVYLVLFASTMDFNPRHLLAVNNDSVVFRTGIFERFEELWYPRYDCWTPSEFLNELNGTEKIIVSDLPQISYYLQRDHMVLLPRKQARFRNVSRERGTIDVWSNRRLLSTDEEIRDTTRDDSVVYWVGQAQKVVNFDQIWSSRPTSYQRVFLGIDGRIAIWRIELNDPGARQNKERAVPVGRFD